MRDGLKAATAAIMVIAGGVSARAAPLFSNPNFAGPAGASPYYYNYNGGTDSWLSTNTATSETGYAPKDPTAFWDNGVAPGGVSSIAFVQNQGAELSQTVAGFTVGNYYTISIAADARAATPNNALGIFVNGVDYGGASSFPPLVTSVDPYNVYSTPWGTYTSAAFMAASTSLTIGFVNDGGGSDVTIDLANPTIANAATPVVPVAEPASILLLLGGLGGMLLMRRRSAAV